MKNRRDNELRPDDTAKNLGMLYTGYLDKRNPVNGNYHVRFVVLTHDFVHWFKRSSEGQELFGEERGHVGLESILSVRVIDEDSTCFELQSTDHVKRYFRGSSPSVSEEWVSAIRSAIKGFLDKNSRVTEGHESGVEVFVNLITLQSKTDGTELVISRSPAWDRIVNIPLMKRGDSILLSTTNAGSVTLSYEMMSLKSEDEIDFEASVQCVPLASCLRISVRRCIPFDKRGGSGNISYSSNEKGGGSIQKFIRKILLFLSIVSKHQNNSMTLVLSVMVMLVGCASVPYLGPDTSLLFVFATVLSCHSILRMFFDISKESDFDNGESNGQLFSLTVLGHSFTSADAPISQLEDEIPKRFIDGCEGDLKEARRRWDITRRWRETEGVNKIFETKQPYFSLIKSMYPFYHAGRGREGHVVFYERPGDLESAQLAARGIVIDDLLKHWIFVTEYQWRILAEGDETAKGIAVIDVGTVRIGDLAGDNLEYVRKTIAYANAHYPERSHVIYLVNAPVWFSMLWRVVRPLVHPNTQKKVRILTKSDTLKGMQEHIDISNIPEYYGGQLDFGGHDSCRYYSPEVIDLNNFVQRVNDGDIQPINKFDVDQKNKNKSNTNTPPGQPGEFPSNLQGGGSVIASSRSSDYSQNSYRIDNERGDGTDRGLDSELDRTKTNSPILGPALIPNPRIKSMGPNGMSGARKESIFSSANIHPMGQHRNNNTPNNYEYNNHNSHVVGNMARKNVFHSSASSPMHSLVSPLTADISL